MSPACCMRGVHWRARAAARRPGWRWVGEEAGLTPPLLLQVNSNARFCPHELPLQPLRQCCCGFFDIAVGFRCAPTSPLPARAWLACPICVTPAIRAQSDGEGRKGRAMRRRDGLGARLP